MRFRVQGLGFMHKLFRVQGSGEGFVRFRDEGLGHVMRLSGSLCGRGLGYRRRV